MASGIATPTESAALGALATIIFALLYRALSLKILVSSVQSTLAVSGMVLFIIVGATGFAQMLGFSGASDGLLKIIISQGFSPFTVVIAMLIILLLLGSFVDQVSMMLLTLPFFMPLVIGMKIDPIWFGVLFLFTMQIGLMSPPFGLLTITMKSVVPRHLTMWQVYLSAIPYVTIVFLMMVAILFFPAIVTWLPNLIE
jgi:TRAP-type mannitol/chloroaromatic compound transport system permease large subunit